MELAIRKLRKHGVEVVFGTQLTGDDRLPVPFFCSPASLTPRRVDPLSGQ
jgi:hypothetical protein